MSQRYRWECDGGWRSTLGAWEDWDTCAASGAWTTQDRARAGARLHEKRCKHKGTASVCAEPKKATPNRAGRPVR